MLTERTFDTGAVALNYAEGLKSGPPLVLLHGVTSRWQVFLHLIPTLLPRWHVVAVDLRGHGKSGRVPGHYGVMDYAEDVLALIRHLDAGPAAVLGHSLGAMVTIGAAAEAPELVRAAILEDPPLGAFQEMPFTQRPEHDGFVATRNLVREGLPPDELARRILAGPGPNDALAARLRAASLSQIDADVLTFIIENRAIVGFDLADRLRRVACPTLLFQGNPELGGALSDAEADWAMTLLATGFLVRMPGAGHFLRLSPGLEANRFAQATVGFLETV